MTRPRSKSPAKADGQKIVPQPRWPARAAKFDEVLGLIEAARRRAYQAVNTELVGLYWQLGEYISEKIASAESGDGVVDEPKYEPKYPEEREFYMLAAIKGRWSKRELERQLRTGVARATGPRRECHRGGTNPSRSRRRGQERLQPRVPGPL